MVLHLKRLLVLTLLCLAPLAQADIQRLQTLHELRSEGFTAATYMLIDNNLFERVRDPSHRTTYNRSLANMTRLINQLGNPDDLAVLSNTFVLLIQELEAMGDDQAHYSLSTVNRIMQAHGEFDRVAARHYAEAIPAANAPERLLTLHQQSLETSQILLLYQNNMFSSVGVYFLENQDGLFDMLDQSIVARALQLKSLYPEQIDALLRLEKQYNFIQPRLQDPLNNWVPSIAAFYLQRNVKTLNDLAREQVLGEA